MEHRHPGRKRFEAWEIRRLPVSMDSVTSTYIGASSWEGRHFPQAVDEAFGKIPEAETVTLQLAAHSVHFPDIPDDGTRLLEIVVSFSDSDPMQFLLNAVDLEQQHPSGLYGFNAALTAAELVRLAEHKRSL